MPDLKDGEDFPDEAQGIERYTLPQIIDGRGEQMKRGNNEQVLKPFLCYPNGESVVTKEDELYIIGAQAQIETPIKPYSPLTMKVRAADWYLFLGCNFPTGTCTPEPYAGMPSRNAGRTSMPLLTRIPNPNGRVGFTSMFAGYKFETVEEIGVDLGEESNIIHFTMTNGLITLVDSNYVYIDKISGYTYFFLTDGVMDPWDPYPDGIPDALLSVNGKLLKYITHSPAGTGGGEAQFDIWFMGTINHYPSVQEVHDIWEAAKAHPYDDGLWY